MEDRRLRLPKPIYEILPFFLIGVGIFLIALVLNRYEHAPTLAAWLLGLTAIVAGVLMLAARIYSRALKPRED